MWLWFQIHVALVPVFAVLFNIPRLFEYKLKDMGHNNVSTSQNDSLVTSNTLHRRLALTEIGESVWFRIVYKNVCFYLLMYIIPLAVLVFVSIRLLQALRMHKLSRRRIPEYSRQQCLRDNNVTVILIIVIVVFIVCQTPTLFQRLVLALAGSEGLGCGQPYNYLERTADYLVVFNSCGNFVVYVLFARQFRQILMSDILQIQNMRANGSVMRRNEEIAECFFPSSEVSKDHQQQQQFQNVRAPLNVKGRNAVIEDKDTVVRSGE